MQYTLKNSIEIKGIGLHSGCDSIINISPAAENTGIIFQRTDIENAKPIRALYNNVLDTRNCTCIGDSPQNIVSTIEHLMAVLYVLGIDNAYITINNPEIPILDGSGRYFLKN
jgi:UDP-3-O-[3-hydroxymyristoyl] N-acetylglucosamine deacetylase